jgi:hypothetical protein
VVNNAHSLMILGKRNASAIARSTELSNALDAPAETWNAKLRAVFSHVLPDWRGKGEIQVDKWR